MTKAQCRLALMDFIQDTLDNDNLIDEYEFRNLSAEEIARELCDRMSIIESDCIYEKER